MRDLKDYQLKYSVSDNFEETMASIRKKKILAILNSYQPKRILEVGCGTSSIAEFYTDFESFVVVEPISEFIDQTKKKISKREYSSKVSFVNQTIENAGLGLNNDFDFIIVSSLIHELENPKMLVDSVKKLMGQKTMIHINVPNALSLHNRLAKHMGLVKDVFQLSETAKKFQRHKTYSLQTLTEFAVSCGFQIVDQGSYFLKPFSNKQMNFLHNNTELFPASLFEAFDSVIEEFPELGSEIYVNLRRLE